METVCQPLPVRHRHRVNHRRLKARIRRLLAGFLVGTALLAAPHIVFTQSSQDAPPVVEHVVAEGETLWEIADQYSEGQDLRRVVAAIMKYNGLESPVIWPGQVLKIPPGLQS